MNLTNNKIKINIEEELTPERAHDVLKSLDKYKREIQNYLQDFSWCSKCRKPFDWREEKSQHTEDGILCGKCHENYTIKYAEDGGIGVIDNKTGEWVNSRFLCY